VDVRIVAATHQNLEDRIKDGRFREDLFHRLNVIRIHIPPLRERREDITQLTRFFLGEAAEELNVEPKILKSEVLDFLMRQEWPGNVRQLENLCRRLAVMAPVSFHDFAGSTVVHSIGGGVAVGRAPEDDPVAVTFERKEAGKRFLSARPGVLQRFGDLWVAVAAGEFVAATAVSNTRHEALPVLETTTTDAPMLADSTFPRDAAQRVARSA